MALKNIWRNIQNTVWLKVGIGVIGLGVAGAATVGVVHYQQKTQQAMVYQTAEQYESARAKQALEELDLSAKHANYSQILMMNDMEAALLACNIPEDGFSVEEVVVESEILSVEEQKKEDAMISREPSVKPSDTAPTQEQTTDIDSNWNGAPGWATISGNRYYYTSEGRRVRGDQVIDGRHYYFNDKGALASYCGIDVSRWQGSIDWSAVKADGIDYAIIRAGYRGSGTGVLAEDPTFARNIHGAYNAGIDVGVYYFSQAISVEEAQEEAYAVLTLIRREGVPITYPVIIDLEDTWYDGSTPGRANGNSPELRTQIASAFCSVIASAGYKPMVYGSKSYLQNRFAGHGSYNVWVAHYADMPRTNYSGSYQMWQYTSTGHVAGISGNVDMNICYVDYKYGRNLESIGTYAITTVPNLSGMTLEQAKAALERVSLKYTITEDYSDTVPSGSVVSQSVPADTQVDEQSTVEVVISKGIAPKTMVNVVGLSQTEAKAKLEALGLTVIINSEANNSVAAGVVFAQSVAEGTVLQKGDSVILKVSTGSSESSSEENSSENSENSSESTGASDNTGASGDTGTSGNTGASEPTGNSVAPNSLEGDN